MSGRIGTFLSVPIKAENMPSCLLHELQTFCVGLIIQYNMQIFQLPFSPDCKARTICTPKMFCLIFVNLINMCLGVFCPGFILFGTLWVSWTWVTFNIQAAQSHIKPINISKLTTGHFIALQTEEIQLHPPEHQRPVYWSSGLCSCVAGEFVWYILLWNLLPLGWYLVLV